MNEILKYPMALYHPVTKELTIVADAKEHDAITASWDDETKAEDDVSDEENVVSINKRKPGRPKKA